MAISPRALASFAAKAPLTPMEAAEYLENIKSRLIASNAIAAFTITEELDLGDRVKILVVAANPLGSSPLKLDHEVKTIQEALRQSPSIVLIMRAIAKSIDKICKRVAIFFYI